MSPIPKDLWSNEETWIVQLWLMNNEGAHEIARKAAREAWKAAAADQMLSRRDNATVALGHWLKDSIESNHPLHGTPRDMYRDLLAHSLGRVDWREIARHWLDAYAQEAHPGPR